jgi:hypothetical protein
MKALFSIGLIVLALGILSLFVPIPHRERDGLKVGDVSLGITTRHDETVAPVVSALVIAAGAGMLFGARRQKA